jgi:hypothetical protein
MLRGDALWPGVSTSLDTNGGGLDVPCPQFLFPAEERGPDDRTGLFWAARLDGHAPHAQSPAPFGGERIPCPACPVACAPSAANNCSGSLSFSIAMAVLNAV